MEEPNDRICSVDGCDREVFSNARSAGICSFHYQRRRMYGQVEDWDPVPLDDKSPGVSDERLEDIKQLYETLGGEGLVDVIHSFHNAEAEIEEYAGRKRK